MKKFAVIAAGGSGLRMGTTVPKQFLLLRDKPVLLYTIESFLQAFDDLRIILVLPEIHLTTGQQIIQSSSRPERITMTVGGKTRFHSVKAGLGHIQQHSIVFVHDGVRCLPSSELIHRCYEVALVQGNAIPAITAVDTIRMETTNGNTPIDRSKIRIIQTPQTFYSDLLKAAFEQDYHEHFTDEACVVEKLGIKINLVEGESSNIKITRQIDLLIAEKILEEREFRS